MAFLEKFTASEQDRLIRLPYQAGAWLSSQDDTGGAFADFKEKRALKNIIEDQSKGMFVSAFVHEVMADLSLREDDWEKWDVSEKTVLEESAELPVLITEKLSEEQADAYIKSVMAISVAVAQAYREFDDNTSFAKALLITMKLKIDRVFGALSKQEYDSERLLAVSHEEDVALTKLYDTLRQGLKKDKETEMLLEET